MKGSPIFPGFDHENHENTNYEFDAQTDFSQFLEEARKHATLGKDSPGMKCGQKQEVIIKNQETKKSKKSWKNVLFPFWRLSSDKKNKTKKEEHIDSQPKKPKHRSYISGPVHGHGVLSAAKDGGIRLSASGPLTGIFQPKKREEHAKHIPYVSLEKLNKPAYDAKVYGPVYLVS